MSPLESSERTQLPIACTLDAADGGERLARWGALSSRSIPSVRRHAGELVVAYPTVPGVREELEVLAAAERQCCSFAEWEVGQTRTRSCFGLDLTLPVWQQSPRRSAPADVRASAAMPVLPERSGSDRLQPPGSRQR